MKKMARAIMTSTSERAERQRVTRDRWQELRCPHPVT